MGLSGAVKIGAARWFEHYAAVFYQLPPGLKLDNARLEHFLQVLPGSVRHVGGAALLRRRGEVREILQPVVEDLHGLVFDKCDP